MHIYATYGVKIKHYNHIFKDTVAIYRQAVDFLIIVCLEHWTDIAKLNNHDRLRSVEGFTHKTKSNPAPEYDFDT